MTGRSSGTAAILAEREYRQAREGGKTFPGLCLTNARPCPQGRGRPRPRPLIWAGQASDRKRSPRVRSNKNRYGPTCQGLNRNSRWFPAKFPRTSTYRAKFPQARSAVSGPALCPVEPEVGQKGEADELRDGLLETVEPLRAQVVGDDRGDRPDQGLVGRAGGALGSRDLAFDEARRSRRPSAGSRPWPSAVRVSMTRIWAASGFETQKSTAPRIPAATFAGHSSCSGAGLAHRSLQLLEAGRKVIHAQPNLLPPARVRARPSSPLRRPAKRARDVALPPYARRQAI